MNARLPLPMPDQPPVVKTVTKPVGAVVSAIEILRCLGRHAAPRRLSEITRELGLNPSTTLNILRTLEHEGLVRRDADGRRYGLGQGLVDLAGPLLAGDGPARRFSQALDDAAAQLGVTIALWRRVGDEVELVQVGETSAVMRIAFTVGRRLPMFLGAMGRLIAGRGAFSTEELRAGFQRVHWTHAPSHDEWLAEINTARETGVAFDHGRVNRGVIGIAVPVEAEGPVGRVIAAAMFESDAGPDTAVIVQQLKTLAALAADIPGARHA